MALVNVGDLVRYRRAIPLTTMEGFVWVEETGVVVEARHALVDNPNYLIRIHFQERNKIRTVTATLFARHGKVIG